MRLYPDIIVAIEIDSTRLFEHYEESKQDIIVSIGNCLAHQKDYQQYAIPNAFIGFEGKVWSAEDYRYYLNSLPEFFERLESSNTEYKVNMEALNKSYYKLFTQGTYSDKVLKYFSLI